MASILRPLVVAVVACVLTVACVSQAEPVVTEPGADQPSRSLVVDRCSVESPSAPTRMVEAALELIRQDRPEPTVHARNLFHLSAAQWDVWSAVHAGDALFAAEAAPASSPSDREMSAALAHAAHVVLNDRYGRLGSDAMDGLAEALDDAMAEAECAGPIGDEWSVYGAAVGSAVLAATADDGSADGDAEPYLSVNDPLLLDETGTVLDDPNRWQPLFLAAAETRNGLPEPEGPQFFFASHWGSVRGFALPPADPATGMPVDPGEPPLLGTSSHADFVDGVLVALEHSRALDVGRDDIDLSPAAHGNRATGSYENVGHDINPATGEPYAPNIVDRGDYGRIIAEYWADGPDSETPPGHWNVLAIEVADALEANDALRVAGSGPVVSRTEWDVKAFLALNGALHDAAVAAWGAKAHYDYVRPISAIRHLGGVPDGLAFAEGLVDVVTDESSAEGGPHDHLADHVGSIVVPGWLGQPDPPGSRVAGVDWVLAGDWMPYQRPTFVTPAFPGYVSGHSTFSRAAAEALTGLTGSAYFPGGLYEIEVRPGGLTHEQGPSKPVMLQWATFRDAADEAGISRLYGGIHVPADDTAGRLLGERVGVDAWTRAAELFGLS